MNNRIVFAISAAMLKTLLSLLLLLVLYLGPIMGTTTSATLGEWVQVSANSMTNISFGIDGPSLAIEMSTDANVTLSAFLEMSASLLPKGYQTLMFSAGSEMGFMLSVEPNHAIVLSATLYTPALSASSIALFKESVSVGCLQYNASTSSVSYVDFATFSESTFTISVPLPSAGTFVFVAVNAGADEPTWFGVARYLQRQQNYTLTFAEGLTLQVMSTVNANLTTTFSSTNPFPSPPAPFVSLGVFFNFTLDTSSDSDETVQAIISYAYNESQLLVQNLLASSLRIGFYEESSASWNFPSSGGSVNTKTQVVSQSTDHFSSWGVYGASSSTSGIASNNRVFSMLAMLTSSVFIALVF